MLKKGDIVDVYERPYSNEKLEGAARLVKPATKGAGHVEPGYEAWDVDFDTSRNRGGERAIRIIKSAS